MEIELLSVELDIFPSFSAEPELYDDIGNIIKSTNSIADTLKAVSSLTESQKYNLLVNHYIPKDSHIFPSTYIHGGFRSFNIKFLTMFTWAVYSPLLDGLFCLHCALFAGKGRELLGAFVNAPFTKWHKCKEKLSDHSKKSYHITSVQCSKSLRVKHETPSATLPHIFNENKSKRVQDNRHIVKSIAKAIVYCGKQCIALRGSFENVTDLSKNPGNFIALLRLLAENDPLLQEHLEMPKKKTVKYTSPVSQNELINVVASMIQESVVEEVKEAKYYTIMADEVTSHNDEIMPLCVRFVDKNLDVREEFLKFSVLSRKQECILQMKY